MIMPMDDWLRAGVLQLGLPPSEVWAMSLRDLRILTQPTTALPRDAFAALCKRFPDDPTSEGDTDG